MTKGLIVIGYQGIGKSSIAGVQNNIVDLESSTFKADDGTRPLQWYIWYCKMAVNLAKQGYIVCVSSHHYVCDELGKHMDDPDFDIIIVHPSIELRDAWLKRLADRLGRIPIEKNWIAYANAEKSYNLDIRGLIKHRIHDISIDSLDYDLKDVIDNYLNTH